MLKVVEEDDRSVLCHDAKGEGNLSSVSSATGTHCSYGRSVAEPPSCLSLPTSHNPPPSSPSPSPGHPNILFGHCTTEFNADSAREPSKGDWANNSSSLVANLSITVETSCFSPQLVATKPDASLSTAHGTGGGSLPLVDACTIRANEGVRGGVVAT